MKMKKGMSSVKGMYSTKDNPLKQASKIPRGFSGGSNPDANKAAKLAKKAYEQQDSHRGMGM